MPPTAYVGIDVETASESSENYARLGVELLEQEDLCATWYVTGKTLEKYPDAFVEAEKSGRVDLQAHTYCHLLLKTVWMEIPPGRTYAGRTDWLCNRGGTNDEIEADLARCQEVFRSVLGRPARGLTGPWGYYRGLGDRPDLLDIVSRHGFRFLRTFARNERDGEPIPLEWQPFFYEPQGHGDVLELMVHGYQDDGAFAQLTGLADPKDYVAYLRGLADRVAAEDRVWSMCSHDHRCQTPEAFRLKTGWLRETIRYAKSLGIRFVTASQFYAQRLAERK